MFYILINSKSKFYGADALRFYLFKEPVFYFKNFSSDLAFNSNRIFNELY